MEYVTISPLWHSKELRTIGRGEIVRFEHLDEKETEAVVRAGGAIALTDLAPLLTLPGVGKDQALALIRELGLWKIEQIAALELTEIARVLHFSMDDAMTLRNAARKPPEPEVHAPAPETSAAEMPRPRRPRPPSE
jgi:hypothetical protein